MNFGSTPATPTLPPPPQELLILWRGGRESEREIVKKRLNAPISKLAPPFPTLTPLPISICHETFSGAKCDSRVRNSSPLFSPSPSFLTPSRRNCLPSREPFLRSNGRRRRWRRPLLLRRSGARNGHTLSRKSVAWEGGKKMGASSN